MFLQQEHFRFEEGKRRKERDENSVIRLDPNGENMYCNQTLYIFSNSNSVSAVINKHLHELKSLYIRALKFPLSGLESFHFSG